MIYRRLIKRVFDVAISLTLLVTLLPVIMTIALILSISLRGNPFFVQKRPGKATQPFDLLKLRTMSNKCDNEGNLLPDEQRLTKAGNWVRKLSLDELPQLFNVLKGDMSFVGPRPLLMQYLPLYDRFQNRRHEVRPGITGWAQVNGRNNVNWQKRFELDVWYVDHLNLWLDLRIVALTLIKVIKRSDVNQEGEATMQPFRGNSD